MDFQFGKRAPHRAGSRRRGPSAAAEPFAAFNLLVLAAPPACRSAASSATAARQPCATSRRTKKRM